MNHIQLKPLTINDATLLFKWRNDPYIVSLGSLNKTVTRAEHDEWIKATLRNSNRKVFIIEIDGEPNGQIRFDRIAESKSCVISIYIMKAITGKGIGVAAIQLGCQQIIKEWNDIKQIEAQVLKSNFHAQKAFLKSGFIYNQRFIDDFHHESFIYEVSRKISHSKLSYDYHEIYAVANVIKSGYWAEGKMVKALESQLNEIAQCDFSVAVSSGLSALRIALLSLGVKNGDEVIIPAYSCVALANAALSLGAVPVPADIKLSDLNIDPEDVKRRITTKTKAIIAVHTFGAIADIKALKTFKIPIIEDCAHALGLKTEDGFVGNLGDAAICSFYATKLIGGGEGGAILTNNISIAKKAEDLRDYTDKSPSAFHLNEKMSDIHAALSLEQLKKCAYFLKKRKEVATSYLIAFSESNHKFSIPGKTQGRIWYRFVVNLLENNVDEVIEKMETKDIMCRKPVEYWINKTEQKSYPNASKAYEQIISLPIYPELQPYEQEQIIATFLKVI